MKDIIKKGELERDGLEDFLMELEQMIELISGATSLSDAGKNILDYVANIANRIDGSENDSRKIMYELMDFQLSLNHDIAVLFQTAQQVLNENILNEKNKRGYAQ